jgi:hypothetical protein
MLVSEFGKKQVLEALATIEGVDVQAVERELVACQGKKRATKARRRKSVPELLDQARVRSDVRPALEQVAYAYESRQFLPDLSKVRDFLGERGVDPSKLRTRADALPKVINVLAQEPTESLERLLAPTRNDRGDLGILADHILGRPERSAKVAVDRSLSPQ